jgi:hypothetical protein
LNFEIKIGTTNTKPTIVSIVAPEAETAASKTMQATAGSRAVVNVDYLFRMSAHNLNRIDGK